MNILHLTDFYLCVQILVDLIFFNDWRFFRCLLGDFARRTYGAQIFKSIQTRLAGGNDLSPLSP
jgi:hypothetical protein